MKCNYCRGNIVYSYFLNNFNRKAYHVECLGLEHQRKIPKLIPDYGSPLTTDDVLDIRNELRSYGKG